MSWIAWIALLGPVAGVGVGFGLGWHRRALKDAEEITQARAFVERYSNENRRLRNRLQNALDIPTDDEFDRMLEATPNGHD